MVYLLYDSYDLIGVFEGPTGCDLKKKWETFANDPKVKGLEPHWITEKFKNYITNTTSLRLVQEVSFNITHQPNNPPIDWPSTRHQVDWLS